jgi:hypothetical protein
MNDLDKVKKSPRFRTLDPFWFTFGAFLFVFFWFFIRSVFFNPSRVMMVFETVRRLDPIGYDLMMMVSHATAWLEHSVSPFASFNNFPPFATLLFTPFSLVSLPTAYSIITIITLAGLLWSGFVFPYLQQNPRAIKPVLVLVFTSTLISYGLQFEIERGQFYTLAFALAFLGVYIFHRHPRLSWFAYILFTLAIQLKMFPALLIFLFVRDWRDWRGNLLRIFGLGLVNFALFFILGWNKFLEFMNILFAMNDDPGIWVGNFSVRSFTHRALPVILKRFDITTGWLENGAGVIEALLLGLVVLLMGLGIYKAFRQNRGGIDPYLLFLCTAAALVIPPISHDYKLPLLTGPAAILVMSLHIPKPCSRWRSVFLMGAVILFSLAYFSTQYSYSMKSPHLANNFPAVLGMMGVAATLAFINPIQDERKNFF